MESSVVALIAGRSRAIVDIGWELSCDGQVLVRGDVTKDTSGIFVLCFIEKARDCNIHLIFLSVSSIADSFRASLILLQV